LYQKAKENIYRHKRKEVTGGWRRLHNEDFHNLCSLTLLGWSRWRMWGVGQYSTHV